jgi:S-phase kinase-associated protein 1
MITLISKTNTKHPIKINVSKISGLIQTALDGDEDCKIINLKSIEAPVINKVIEYMNHYECKKPKDIEKPLSSTNMEDAVDKWDADFIDVDQKMLFKLVLAANYLDIQPLLELSCAKVGSFMVQRTPKEIRKIFHIDDALENEKEKEKFEKMYQHLIE